VLNIKEVSDMKLTPFKRNSDLALFDPFRMESLFESMANDDLFPVFPAVYKSGNQMKVDIKEKENEYLIEADLPGYKKEDVTVDFNNNLLTISAAKSEEKEEKGENYLRRERRYGSTSRSFTMDNVDVQKISAKFDNGVLSLTLPKILPTAETSTKIKVE